jgi:hypothetical protein
MGFVSFWNFNHNHFGFWISDFGFAALKLKERFQMMRPQKSVRQFVWLNRAAAIQNPKSKIQNRL